MSLTLSGVLVLDNLVYSDMIGLTPPKKKAKTASLDAVFAL